MYGLTFLFPSSLSFVVPKVTVKSGCNPDKVKAHGDGLERGFVDEHNQFVIETRNAGTGGLGLAMEGPNEAQVQVHITRHPLMLPLLEILNPMRR